jgi:hypothetical protein
MRFRVSACRDAVLRDRYVWRQRVAVRRRLYALLGAACFALTIRAAPGDELLTPLSPTCSEEFGAAVSASAAVPGRSGRLLVGAYTDNDKGTSSGSAYLYEEQTVGTWTLAAKLLASDGAAYDWFGFAVGVDGDRAVSGARQDDDNGSSSGSAYVFERQTGGTWTQVAKLLPSDGHSTDDFGGAVAISGARVLVGAPYNDDNGTDSGSAYVFERQDGGTWTQVAKLLPADGAAYDYFGCAVAIYEDTAVVGANEQNTTATDSGAVYVFTRQSNGTWTQAAKLKASDAQAVDHFGEAVALHGSVLAVGAPEDNDRGTDGGSAYVFTQQSNGTWTQTTKLLAPTPEGGAYDKFGSSVATDGWHVLAGIPADEPSSAGSACLFQFDATAGWTLRARLTRTGAASYDEFGSAVALNNNYAFSGAPGTNGGSYSRAGSTSVVAIEHSPSDIALSRAWVADGVPGATVGTLSATDLDTPESFIYAVPTNPSGPPCPFEASGDELRLKADASADWGAKSSHTVEVKVTDRTNHEFYESFTVAVNRLPTADAQPGLELLNALSLAITLAGSDLDGHALDFEITQFPESGTLSGTPPNVTYTPRGCATSAEFRFRVVDELGGASAPATVHIDLPDSDANGLPDWWEVTHLTPPFAPSGGAAGPAGDPDGDGLSNQDECEAGTDPNIADSDSDGFMDGWEHAHELTGMNPLAANTIQDAVDAAADNETVILLPGAYSQKVVFDGRGITLTGRAPSDPDVVDRTVLQTDATTGSLVYFGSSEGSASVRGISIVLGQAQYGGGVYCEAGATATVADCVLEGNRASTSGGAVFAGDGSEITIERCTIRDNDAHTGGGIAAQAGAVVALTNCYITENGNRPVGYPCSRGGGVYLSGSTATVLNCTVAANSTTSTGLGGGIYTSTTGLAVTNSIVYANTGSSQQGSIQIGAPTGISANYSCIQGGWATGTGNITVAPQFTDAANGDYSLKDASPCIDAGTASGAPDEDRNGDPRPCPKAPGQTAGVDMGADEYSFSVLLTIDDASGTADPPTGTYNLPWGSAVTVAVPSDAALGSSGRTRFDLNSITGTGSAPAQTEGTAVSFTATANSEVSFNWDTEHLLSLKIIGAGTIQDAVGADAVEEWYPEGTAVLLHAVPGDGSVFASWAGNVPSGQSLGPALPVTLSTPIHAVALFRAVSSGKGPGSGGSPDYKLTLKAGWNLISFPILPSSGSTELPTWAAILTYSGYAAGPVGSILWIAYREADDPDLHYRLSSADWSPHYGDVCWVYVEPAEGTGDPGTTLCIEGACIRERANTVQDGDLQIMHLTSGWNPVSFDASGPMAVPEGIVAVWAWDTETGWTPVSLPTNAWQVMHGRGYFVYSDPTSLDMPRSTSLDSDGDGLSDIWESYYDCDEANPDTDGDALPDGWEAAYATEPTTPDADTDLDGDGLTNAQEFAAGTAPRATDTDGDGNDDGDEDADADGLTNGLEVQAGTLLNHPDSDGDGVSDGIDALPLTALLQFGHPVYLRGDVPFSPFGLPITNGIPEFLNWLPITDATPLALAGILDAPVTTLDPTGNWALSVGSLDLLEPGRGYSSVGLDEESFAVVSGLQPLGYYLSLAAGWNSITMPFPTPLPSGTAIDDVRMCLDDGSLALLPEGDEDQRLRRGSTYAVHCTAPHPVDLSTWVVDPYETADPTRRLPGWFRKAIADASLTDHIATSADVDPGGDYDGDGLSNRCEFLLGTDPTCPDSDGDGMEDGYEATRLLVPARLDPAPQFWWTFNASTFPGANHAAPVGDPTYGDATADLASCVDDEHDLLGGALAMGAESSLTLSGEDALSELNGAQAISIALWMRPTAPASGRIASRESVFALDMNSDGTLTLTVTYSATSTASFTTQAVPVVGRWNHVLLRLDTSSEPHVAVLYLNGERCVSPDPGSESRLEIPVPGGLNLDAGTAPLRFGHSGTTDGLPCRLDDIRVFTAAMTLEAARRLYECMDDPDGDGLSNLDEAVAITNPRSADTDHDGMSDAWELGYALDPLGAADAMQDSDGDGVANLVEFRQGRGPRIGAAADGGSQVGLVVHTTLE